MGLCPGPGEGILDGLQFQGAAVMLHREVEAGLPGCWGPTGALHKLEVPSPCPKLTGACLAWGSSS